MFPDGQVSYAAGYNNGLNVSIPMGVLAHYDHVVVAERVQESMVTLSRKLGLIADDLIFLSQKKSGNRPLDVVTQEQKARIDGEIRSKNKNDLEFHRGAVERLDRELASLPKPVREILDDLPKMKAEVMKECGHIEGYDNSCLPPGFPVWDGNNVCVAMCISRWADKNIRCR